MKNRFFIFTILSFPLVFILSACLGQKSELAVDADDSGKPKGTLVIITEPGDAQIFINDIPQILSANTPENSVVVTNLTEGTYTLEARREHSIEAAYFGRIDNVSVTGDSEQTLTISMMTVLTEEGERLRQAEAEKQQQEILARRQAAHFSRYEIHRDGTVTDKQTDLMWMRCRVGQQWVNNRCTGVAEDHNESSANATVGAHRFAGYRDWRIPSLRELHSIVYCSSAEYGLARLDFDALDDPGNQARGNLWESLVGRNLCLDDFPRPTINLLAFPDPEIDAVLTSNPINNESNPTWVLNFSDNQISKASNQFLGSLIFVRDASSRMVVDGFLAMEGGTVVRDLETGLEWMRCAVGQGWNSERQTCVGEPTAMSWDLANELTRPDGFRLPEVNELRSLVYCSNRRGMGTGLGMGINYSPCGEPGSFRSPTINPGAFPGSQPGWFWSASPYGNEAWYVSFSNGMVSHSKTSANNRARLVRGNFGD